MANKLSSGITYYRNGGTRALWLAALRSFTRRDPRISDLHPRHDCLRSHIEYLNDMQNITAAEIGVWEGRHAKSLQEQLDIEKMYLIDPYDAYEDYEENKSDVKRMRNAEEKAHKRLKKYDNTVFIKEYSDAASEQIDSNLDYVYIDGNHSYEYVKKDIEEYYTMVNSGGVVAGHDFSIPWTGVIQAVTDFCKERNVTYHLENHAADWYIIK